MVIRYFTVFFFVQLSYTDEVFRLANHFGNHMVLQREPHQSIIWGYGQMHQLVFVSIAGKTYMTKVKEANENGCTWFLKLDAQESSGPYDLHAWSTYNKTKVYIHLSDVYFGDVWFCSGQSNMGFTVSMSYKGKAETTNSSAYNLVRLVKVKRYASNVPVDEISIDNLEQKWYLPSPETVGGPAWTYYSAVCWMFGRRLFDVLKVPIGLVETAYGGSSIEAWSSKDVLLTCKVTTPITNSTKDQLSVLWNAMIHPFLSMSVYGVIWYQGEGNCLRPSNYDCLFPNMIRSWRENWHRKTRGSLNHSLPIGFVQLGTIGNNISVYPPDFNSRLYIQNIPLLRWKQTGNYGFVPNQLLTNTFMATAMDLPDDSSPYYPIHFRDKTDVAVRLLQGALSIAYNKKNIYWTGPIVDNVIFKQVPQVDHLYTCHVIFKSISIGDAGLELRNRFGFEILFTNTSTNETTEWLSYAIKYKSKNSVALRVWKFEEFEITAIRYHWEQQPCAFKRCALYSNGFPALPFLKMGPFKIY